MTAPYISAIQKAKVHSECNEVDSIRCGKRNYSEQNTTKLILVRDSADLAAVRCGGSLLDNIWAEWVETLFRNVHNLQKSLGKLHRKRARKSVLSVIFTSSDSDRLFVLSTSHTTSSISSLNHNHYETGLTRTAESIKKKKLKATPKRGINNVLHFASKAIWYFTASKLLNTETDRVSSTVCQSKHFFFTGGFH